MNTHRHIKIIPVLLIIAAMIFSSCAAGGNTGKAEYSGSEGSEASTAINSEDPVNTNSETANPSGSSDTAPKRMIEVYNYTDTKKYFNIYKNDLKISGIIYLPEGEGPFPTVFFAQGFAASCIYYEDIAVPLAGQGIAAVLFEFTRVLSPTEDFSVLTEAEDMKDVIDGVSTMPYIDENQMFLWGHSFGGMVSAYVGCNYPGEIKGMVLLEPAFHLHDEAREQYPEGTEIPEVYYEDGNAYRRAYFEDLFSFDIYEKMPEFEGKVMIYAGTEEPSIGASEPEYLERAQQAFPDAELVYIKGANHYFGDYGRDQMTIGTLRFILGLIEQD